MVTVLSTHLLVFIDMMPYYKIDTLMLKSISPLHHNIICFLDNVRLALCLLDNNNIIAIFACQPLHRVAVICYQDTEIIQNI